MNELSPDSNTSKAEKYRLAWNALTGASWDDACHAKCWLTYRAIDGEIKLEDWKNLIEPISPTIPDINYAIRWRASINTANFYLYIISDDEEMAFNSASIINEVNLYNWPGALLNWCRVNTILIHKAAVENRWTECENKINHVLTRWKSVMGGFDPLSHPVRFIESLDDLRCLHLLILMAKKMGMLQTDLPDHPWVNNYTLSIQRSTEPWMTCINHVLSKKKSISNAEITIPSSRKDLGLLVPPGGIVAELGVASGAYSSVLLRTHKQIGKLYAIDKWNDERHRKSEKDSACKALADRRAVIIHQTFEEAAQSPQLEGVEFDLIYVDGYAHTGQEAGATLEQWWPKVKPGAIFAGHDYDTAWPLTIKEVNNFAAKHSLIINTIHERPYNSWWVRKAE